MVSLPSARLADIAALLDFLDSFCEQAGIGPDDQFDVRLAVEEVATNVMMHGYAERAPGPLEIAMCADAEQVTVTISDRAAPFDPEQAPTPDLTAAPDERQIGGLGWHLVKQVVDQLLYRYDPTYGNVVTMVKHLQPRTTAGLSHEESSAPPIGDGTRSRDDRDAPGAAMDGCSR